MLKRTRDATRQRNTPGRALYATDRWKRLRRAFLRAQPICAVCAGRATHVDHIRPHRGDVGLFFDVRNLQGLCHGCHSSKTARADGGFGNPRHEMGAPTGACDAAGRPLDPRHPWNQA